jgi:hypothetical protein
MASCSNTGLETGVWLDGPCCLWRTIVVSGTARGGAKILTVTPSTAVASRPGDRPGAALGGRSRSPMVWRVHCGRFEHELLDGPGGLFGVRQDEEMAASNRRASGKRLARIRPFTIGTIGSSLPMMMRTGSFICGSHNQLVQPTAANS